MRILVDITHPAHVHFFRNAIDIWRQHGHEIAVTARKKDITIALLNHFNISHSTLSEMGKGKLSLFRELIQRDFRLWKFCRKFKPDVLTAIGGVFVAQVGWLIRKPTIVWDDTEHAGVSHKMTFPFAHSILTPDCYIMDLGKKQEKYAGCHELAYLHPNRFTPDKNVLRKIGINPDEKYCVVRMVSWQAHHDVGQSGFDLKKMTKFLEEISKHARPYLSVEGCCPDSLKPYQLSIPVHQIHHVIAFASLCITEGATMASEAAVLGVPAVYVNSLRLGYIDMLEKYGLVRQSTDISEVQQYCLQFLQDEKLKDRIQQAHQKLLDDKIDVTNLVVTTIENAVR